MTCKSGVNWTINNVRFYWTRPRSPIFHASNDILRATKHPEPDGPQELSAYLTYLSCLEESEKSCMKENYIFFILINHRKLTELWDTHHSLEPRRILKVCMLYTWYFPCTVLEHGCSSHPEQAWSLSNKHLCCEHMDPGAKMGMCSFVVCWNKRSRVLNKTTHAVDTHSHTFVADDKYSCTTRQYKQTYSTVQHKCAWIRRPSGMKDCDTPQVFEMHSKQPYECVSWHKATVSRVSNVLFEVKKGSSRSPERERSSGRERGRQGTE